MNNRRKLLSNAITLTLVACATAVQGQSLKIGMSGSIPAGTSATVRITPAANGAEQIKHAIELQRKLDQAQEPQQKMQLLAETLANLSAVPKMWPNDTAAIIRAAIMKADIGAEFGLFPNIIEALLPIAPLVQKTDAVPGVERRLAEAYEMSGKFAEAEEHLLAAERSLESARVNRVEAEAVLGATAMFYARRNQPREAIKRLRRSAELPGQDVVNKMINQLEILKQAVRLSDDPGHAVARLELATFDDLLFRARATSSRVEDSKLVENMAQDALGVKYRHHL